MRSYFPGGTLNALAPAPRGSIPPTPSVHRLRPGLPGYLIPFAPLAFVPQRQKWASRPPSPRVFFPISTHSTATPGFHLPPPSSSLAVSNAVPRLSRGLLHQTYQAAYALFTPSNSEQRLPPPYHRGCWHGVGRGFLCRYRLSRIHHLGILPCRQRFTTSRPYPARGVAPSGFRPLRKLLDCCLP